MAVARARTSTSWLGRSKLLVEHDENGDVHLRRERRQKRLHIG
jgi:hypothetical protein